MSSLPIQVISQLLINNIVPLMASSASAVASAYFTSPRESLIKTIQEVDEERELEMLQMDHMLTWMEMVFNTATTTANADISKYKQDLYNIYRTICSDYKEYQRWAAYNKSLWLLSGYRKRNTKQLARKIVADVRLFKEGLQLFSLIKQVT